MDWEGESESEEKELLSQQYAVEVYFNDLLQVDDDTQMPNGAGPGPDESEFTQAHTDQDNRWQCVMRFGLKLALPQGCIRSIQPINDLVFELTASGVARIGIMKNHEPPVILYDLGAKFLSSKDLEERHHSQSPPFGYVVFLEDESLGLVVDQVGDIVIPEVDEVMWRTENTKRQWVAGTSKKYGCVFLDMDKI